MSTQENKDFARRAYELVASGNVDDLDRYFTNDLIDHNPSPGQSPGLEGVKELFRQYISAFSDLRVEVHDQIAEGDKVVSRATFRGRHTGEFLGNPPTGKEVYTTVIDILRLSGGKIVERWGISDDLNLLTQLGAIPSQGEPGRRAA